MAKTVKLTAPLTDQDVLQLAIGDTVLISGVIYTARDAAHKRLVEAMEVSKIIAEARERSNACGAGAVAATVAACRALGATRGICLQYTNSYEVVHAIYPSDLDDTTVGYASVVFA